MACSMMTKNGGCTCKMPTMTKEEIKKMANPQKCCENGKCRLNS